MLKPLLSAGLTAAFIPLQKLITEYLGVELWLLTVTGHSVWEYLLCSVSYFLHRSAGVVLNPL